MSIRALFSEKCIWNFYKFMSFTIPPTCYTLLGLVRLHQSSYRLAWIGFKSMSQSMPQNNPNLLKKFYSAKLIMDYNPRAWKCSKLWKAWILSIAH
jgi:hypothetical protein